MFKSLSIKNFRGFKDVNVDRLSRISLFVGHNNVGKTAVLETLFLLLGGINPRLTLTINAFRGIDTFVPDPKDIWGWLFRDRNQNLNIVIEAKTESGSKRKLTVSLAERRDFKLNRRSSKQQRLLEPATTATTETSLGELILDFEHESGKDIRTKASIGEDRLSIEREGSVKLPTSVFVSARAGYTNENPGRYSELEESGKESLILPALQVLEPRLKRLAVLITVAGPMLHGDLGLGKMVPVPMMGEGTGRLLTILLAIATSKEGAVLLDDVDTGLHYSVMNKVWKAIASLARELNVQVFATTHSFECLRSAHESFAHQKTYDFTVHRLDRIDGEIRATDYDRKMLDTAITAGVEIR